MSENVLGILFIAGAVYIFGFAMTFFAVLFHNANTVLNDKPKVSPATCFFSILFLIAPNTFHILEKEDKKD